MIDRVKGMVEKVGRFVERHVWARTARRAISRFLAHDDLQFAGSMAYFALLSLFQLLVLGVIGLSFFMDDADAYFTVVTVVTQATPLESQEVAGIVQSLNESRTGIGILSVAFLLWGALGLFSAINKGINMAWGGPGGPPPSFLRDKIIGVVLILFIAIFGLAAVFVGIGAKAVQDLTSSFGSQPASVVGTILGIVVPLVFAFIALAVLYKVVPTPNVSFTQVWPGALVAALLWEVLRRLFTFYVTSVARYETAFGPISTGITLIVFLYFASVILLLGAQIAEAYSVESGSSAAPAPTPVEVGPSVPINPGGAPPASRPTPPTG